MTLETILSRGKSLVALGYSPAQAAKFALHTPLDVLTVADNLLAPEQGEAGSEWYAVDLGTRDAALVACTVTALAALTHALANLSRRMQGEFR